MLLLPVHSMSDCSSLKMQDSREDQGGPLPCKSGSSWFQVAVVSTGGSKSLHADIQIFAKTSRFGSFLKETVGYMYGHLLLPQEQQISLCPRSCPSLSPLHPCSCFKLLSLLSGGLERSS
ncbi:hypothetical protein LDENG_00295840 [Scomber scombrus]|uniref:Uncharacterized protein n=1 Tax=Scomber scombrus TaxID=13677 RepID=A0AAV1PGC0_SCOSC